MATTKKKTQRRKRPEAVDERDPAVASPTVRTFVDWDPVRLRTAERLADTGNLFMAASICEWILGDDRVSGALDARLDALFGLEPSFEPGVGRKKSAVVKALEAGEDFYESYPDDELRLMMLWGIVLGAAPMRHHWTEHPDHGGRVLPKPEFWHPQTLKWEPQHRRWTIENAARQRIVIEPGDGQWVLHTPYGKHRPWSHGIWRRLARWVLVKHYAIQDWSRHSEKGSILVATSPEGATKAQRRELSQDIQDCGEDAVIALANGFDLKLLEIAANTEAIYKAQIEMADTAIATCIRGGNLSSVVKEGSLAAAKSQHDSNEVPKLRFDAKRCSTTLHDQSLIFWAEFNFGDRRLAPWPAYPVDPKTDRKGLADALTALATAIDTFQTAGIPIDLVDLLAKFDLKIENVPDGIKGRIYQYHLSFGIFTINEIRVRSGLEPIAGGDVRPEPAQGTPAGGGDGAAAFRGQPGAFARALASGASAESNRGFIEGQMWVDDLAESAAENGRRALAPTNQAVLDAVLQADGYDDLREKLRELYKDSDPAELNGLVARAMVLCQLAGRHAVNEDT